MILQQIEKEKHQKLRQSSYLAEVFLQQRSKASWINLGDDNTSYFYSVIKHRILKQAIVQLKDNQGNWQTEQVIARLFVHYYQDLLGKQHEERIRAFRGFLRNGPILTEEHHLNILKPFTEEDVKKVVYSIDINKSSRSDGYGSDFFRAAWSIIGKDVAEAVLEFFQNGQFLKQINATNIALIPKVSTPENASQYRPIACCNVIYKVISKLICLKLKERVSHLVSESQTTFV
ncbi:uncharacterized protein LOC107823591 [Nicotiana tabacum]|uniref:Uncharacterized protein LOC107823591 n=1 Tax=Nicotiana tabacum TaxID=4097 RepID=A0A1S4CXA4_TOBAC|nr:PREDICTED: uncharacterized protein LOC107823591 [Nicotiana tabacum]